MLQKREKVRGELYAAPYAGETEGSLIASLSDIKITKGPKELNGSLVVQRPGSIACNSSRDLGGVVHAGGSGYYIELENGENYPFFVRQIGHGLRRLEDGSFLIETTF